MFALAPLATCLINAQPLLAHHPIHGHNLTDDRSLPSAHSVAADAYFGAGLGAFFT